MASTPGTLSYQQHKDNLAKQILSEEVRIVNIASTAFRATASVEPKFGANKGQSVAIEKWQKLDQNTSPLNEFAEMPLKQPTINETVVTINEYGNGVAYTNKAKSISEYMVDEKIRRLIEINSTETMDSVAGTVAQTANVFYTPTNTAADPTHTFNKTTGSIGATATRGMQSYDWIQLAAQLRNDRITKFDSSNYLAICNAFAMANMFTKDTGVAGNVEILKYANAEANLKGEIGSGYGFRFVEETNVLSTGIGGTAYGGECIIMGDDAICEALVEPENVETEEWNFGRFLAIAWKTLTGFSTVWDYNTDGQYALVRVHDDT